MNASRYFSLQRNVFCSEYLRIELRVGLIYDLSLKDFDLIHAKEFRHQDIRNPETIVCSLGNNYRTPDANSVSRQTTSVVHVERYHVTRINDLISLQEILEKALGGLRHKLQGSRSNLAEAERYRKQQLLLERELSRVRVLLAHNSKVDNSAKRSLTAVNTGLCIFHPVARYESIIKNDVD